MELKDLSLFNLRENAQSLYTVAALGGFFYAVLKTKLIP